MGAGAVAGPAGVAGHRAFHRIGRAPRPRPCRGRRRAPPVRIPAPFAPLGHHGRRPLRRAGPVANVRGLDRGRPAAARPAVRRVAPGGLGRPRRHPRAPRGLRRAHRVAGRRDPSARRSGAGGGMDRAPRPPRQSLRRTPVPIALARPGRAGQPGRDACRHGATARRGQRIAGHGAGVGQSRIRRPSPLDGGAVPRASPPVACARRGTGQAVGWRPAMARSSSGKSVARAAATGGGATYRGQMPVNWYAALVVIVLVGLGSVALAKFHYNQTSPVVEPTTTTTWHAGLAVDIRGTTQPVLPASPSSTKTGLTTTGQGVLVIAPKSSSEAGANATVGKFASE